MTGRPPFLPIYSRESDMCKGYNFSIYTPNSPRSVKNNSNMNPRLSGYISLLGLVFFGLRSLLGIAREWSLEKFAILDAYLRYRTQLLVPVPPECWIFKMASLCYFLVSSYRSALFALSKCNLGSISSFLIFPPAAEHTLQRNMKENSRRGLKTNTKGSACLQEKAWKL